MIAVRPLTMSNFGAFNAMDIGDGPACAVRGGYHCRENVLHAPRPDRRVIFPSLHITATTRANLPSYSQPKPQQKPTPTPGFDTLYPPKNTVTIRQPVKSIEIYPSPTHVDSNIRNATLEPTLSKSNSLDGILISLPKLSLPEEGKSNEEFAPLIPLVQRHRAQDRIHETSAHSTKTSSTPRREKKWVARPTTSKARSCSFDVPSSKSIFGDAAHRRTYYPAASIPTPVSDKGPLRSSKPLCSILHRKSPHSQRCSSTTTTCVKTFGKSPGFSPNEGVISSSTLSQSFLKAHSRPLCLSPAVPTLASPASIKSLHPHRTDNEGLESIGESEDDLERIDDVPRVIARNQCEVRRIQSDTIVAKNEEEHTRPGRESASNESNVSRHASLECLANKRISFDPHVRVFEFPVDKYEERGGDKWFSEDQLANFKEEAIRRIRLRRLTEVIPTGTGRALAVTPKGNQCKTPNNGGKPNGSVNFNHPALGCEDEMDDSRSTRKGSMKGSLSQDRASAITAQEIRNILIVDPHQIFLSLFSKSLNHMIPHASVSTARSAEEAMARIEAARKAFPLSDGGSTHGFDMIVIEERLRVSSSGQQLASGAHGSQQSRSTQTAGDDSVQSRYNITSGSDLIRNLVESEHELSKNKENGGSIRHTLLVGVSARLSLDQEKLEKSGADCTWGKPPPEMNSQLRNELLKLLMRKRNRRDSKLFD